MSFVFAVVAAIPEFGVAASASMESWLWAISRPLGFIARLCTILWSAMLSLSLLEETLIISTASAAMSTRSSRPLAATSRLSSTSALLSLVD